MIQTTVPIRYCQWYIRRPGPLPLPLTRRGAARALRRRARPHPVYPSPLPLLLTRRGAARALRRRGPGPPATPGPQPDLRRIRYIRRRCPCPLKTLGGARSPPPSPTPSGPGIDGVAAAATQAARLPTPAGQCFLFFPRRLRVGWVWDWSVGRDSLGIAQAPPGRLGATLGQRPRGHEKITRARPGFGKQCPLSCIRSYTSFKLARIYYILYLFYSCNESECHVLG